MSFFNVLTAGFPPCYVLLEVYCEISVLQTENRYTFNGQNQNPLVCVISLQHHPIVTSSMRIDFLLSHARLEHQNINFYLRYRKLEAIGILIEKGG